MIEALKERFGNRMQKIDADQWENIYVVGDIHGCNREFERLLGKIDLDDDELVVCVGDVIRKGPDSSGALRHLRRKDNIISVLGNSEVKYLRRDVKVADLRKSDRAFIHRWPLIAYFDDNIVVHGGFHPHQPVSDYVVHDILNIRSLNHGTAYRSPYWFEEYESEERIFFGHTVTRRPIIREHVVGLDTGCVYGGSLTAYDCGRNRCIAVESEKVYRKRSSEEYYEPGARDESV